MRLLQIFFIALICVSTAFAGMQGQDATFKLSDSNSNYITVQVDLQNQNNVFTTDSDSPQPLSRWVLVPSGCQVEVEIDGIENANEITQSEMFVNQLPERAVEVSQTSQFRQYNLAQITVNPVFENNGNAVRLNQADFRVNFVPDANQPQTNAAFRVPSPAVQTLLESMVINPPLHRDSQELIEIRGYNEYYLFVMPDYIEGDEREAIDHLIYRLMEWKRCAGNKVELMLLAEGDERDPDAIRADIQSRYDDLLAQGIEPFDNILLFGEEELEPHDNNAGGQGMDIILRSPRGQYEVQPWLNHFDLKYACLEGGEDDLVADAALSRFHAGNVAMLANGVNKTISYEAEPYMDDPSWFTEGVLEEEILVNADASVGYAVNYLAAVLDHNDFSIEGQFLGGEEESAIWLSEQFATRINIAAGRAQNTHLLYHRNIHTENMFEAVNVFPITLMTSGHGEWAMESLFWVGREYYDGHPERYDDVSGAKGSVVSTCVWAVPETAPNNLLVMSMTHAMLDLELSFGWARQWSLMNLARTYPGDAQRFEFYSDDFMLCGDPGLKAWKQEPRAIELQYDGDLPFYQDWVHVTAVDAQTQEPVSDVMVTLYSGSMDEVNLFDVKFTDKNGQCDFAKNPDVNEEIMVTATGKNILPYRGHLALVDMSVAARMEITALDDSENGNGDGILNSGETAEVSIRFHNYTLGNTGDFTGILSTESEFLTVGDGEISFTSCNSGEQVDGQGSISVTLSPECPDGLEQIVFITASNGNFSHTSAAGIMPQCWSLSAIPGDIISIGEGTLAIALLNNGNYDLPAVTARLESNSWAVNVIEGERSYNAIGTGDTVNPNSPFRVEGHANAIPGMTADLTLILESDGQEVGRVPVKATVGEAGENCPWGPDDYGYYVFDNEDTDFDQVPEYFWTEVSPDDADCDIEGTELELTYGDVMNGWGTVDLPFTFTYYGEEFNSITVSTNGFIVAGENEYVVPNIQNWRMEEGGIGGAYGMIAPFWDDLSRRARESGIYWAYDDEFNTFIVEWYNVIFLGGETALNFQVIIYDTEHYPTATGDNQFDFQYMDIHQMGQDLSANTPYATVGISSPDGKCGYTYSYHNRYDVTAAPLDRGRAIRFTTTPHDMRGTLRGMVRDAISYERIPGATIVTPSGNAVTDENGLFRIEDAFAGVAFPVKVELEEFSQFGDIPRVIVPEGGEGFVHLFMLDDNLNAEDDNVMPVEFGLASVYPNPFNPTTTVKFSLDRARQIQLKVLDMNGREVSTLRSGMVAAGAHEVTWDAGNQPSGLYLVRLSAEDKVQTVKAVLVK